MDLGLNGLKVLITGGSKGIGFTPPKYLVTGDVVTVKIGGLGELSNTIA